MKISVKELVKFVILYSIFMCTLVSEFHFPNSIYYLNDICVIILLFFIIKKSFWKKLKFINCNFLNLWIVIFLLTIFIGIIGNLVPIHLVLWGSRNTLRGLIFFLACILYFRFDDIKILMKIFIKIQYLNFAIGLYQYYILGLFQDRLGGIFGHGNGNALCIFCVIVCSYSLLLYLNERRNMFDMLFCIISSVILGILAEEKLLLIELLIMILICIFICEKKYLKYIFLVFILLFSSSIFNFLIEICPENMSVFKSFNEINQYLSASWEGSYGIPRIGVFSFIKEKIFENKLFSTLFGFGIGNCDFSNFSFLISENYLKYGHYNYRWIFSQWTLMELGIIGFTEIVILFIGFIVFLLIKYHKKCFYKYKTYMGMSIIVTFICIITMWFNSTLRTDTSYIPYFAISVGIICIKEIKLKKFNIIGG